MQAAQPELPMKDVTPKKKAEPEKAAAKKPEQKKAAASPPPEPPAKPKKKGTAVAVSHPQAPAQQKTVLQIIADVAANPNANPATMRELLDMQKEIMADQSKRDFNAAFIALQRDLPSIRRDGKIEIREKVGGERVGKVQQATPYATFNNIMKTIKPLLVKHGFALSFETEPMGERLDGRHRSLVAEPHRGVDDRGPDVALELAGGGLGWRNIGSLGLLCDGVRVADDYTRKQCRQ